MKKVFLFAAAAALFAACSSDNAAESSAVQAPEAEQPVGFNAYVSRGTTRAGTAGTLTASNIVYDSYTFGVFGYYTDNQPYSELSTPNFMYNQQIVHSASDWVYSPLKYWPNEFGNGAISEGEDKLTFFAYAPYVTVIPGTGRIDTSVHTADNALTSGIVGLTSNTTTGDPYVKYYSDFDPDNRVDLCWGVANTALVAANTVTGATANTIAVDAPFVDVIKPKTTDKIAFNFKHALAALNVQIDADVDVTSHAASSLSSSTKIWVRSVTFEGFTNKGALNLHASATEGPLWYELSSTNTRIGNGSVTIYDGRRDGKEGMANAEATSEKPFDLNEQLIQSEPYSTATVSNLATSSGLTGVTPTAINLFNSATVNAPVYVIPTDDNLKVTIVYDVETYDPNVAGYLSDGVTKGSTIENSITKELTISSSSFKLAAGKLYTINLHLGMTSVKFDATVTDWTDQTVDKTDLPVNN